MGIGVEDVRARQVAHVHESSRDSIEVIIVWIVRESSAFQSNSSEENPGAEALGAGRDSLVRAYEHLVESLRRRDLLYLSYYARITPQRVILQINGLQATSDVLFSASCRAVSYCEHSQLRKMSLLTWHWS